MRNWGIAILLLTPACQQQSKPPEKPVEISFDGAEMTDAAARLKHGERLTWTLGCRGCHRDKLEGGRFYEAYASNLTRDLPRYSDAEIERVLRDGVRPSGKPLWGMPSEIFQHLSATDLKALIAYLRTLHPEGKPTGKMLPFGKEAKELIARGDLKPAAEFVRDNRTKLPVDLGLSHAQGRYIASVTCAECHGAELKGDHDFTPDLVVAGGYSRSEFETLLTKGVLPNGRKFKNPLMGEVARHRFSRLTVHERDVLYAYLKSRAEKAA